MKMLKIKDFFKKVKKFSLTKFLLDKKISSIKLDIEFKKALISEYSDDITMAEATIVVKNKGIKILNDEIVDLETNIYNIEKLL